MTYVAKNYVNIPPTMLTENISGINTLLTVLSTSGFPSSNFTVAIDRGNPSQEICFVSAITATTMVVVRNYDGAGVFTHVASALVELVATASDLETFNAHVTQMNDDHPTLMKSDGSRHNMQTRHPIGTSLPIGNPTPSNVNDVQVDGAGSALVASDHGHQRKDTYSVFLSYMLFKGLIIPISSSLVDNRFLLCNGGWYNQQDYALLFGLIGLKFTPYSGTNPGTGSSPFSVALHFAVPTMGQYNSAGVFSWFQGQQWGIVA